MTELDLFILIKHLLDHDLLLVFLISWIDLSLSALHDSSVSVALGQFQIAFSFTVLRAMELFLLILYII